MRRGERERLYTRGGRGEIVGSDGYDMFHILTVAMVSQVYTCDKVNQTVSSKYVQFMVCQFYLNKAVT